LVLDASELDTKNLYVAITRPQNSLIVCSTDRTNGSESSEEETPMMKDRSPRSPIAQLGAQLIPVLAGEPDHEVVFATLASLAAIACARTAEGDVVTYHDLANDFIQAFRSVLDPVGQSVSQGASLEGCLQRAGVRAIITGAHMFQS
jgi:hypothetical protein